MTEESKEPEIHVQIIDIITKQPIIDDSYRGSTTLDEILENPGKFAHQGKLITKQIPICEFAQGQESIFIVWIPEQKKKVTSPKRESIKIKIQNATRKDTIFEGKVPTDFTINSIIPETFDNYKLAYQGKVIDNQSVISSLIEDGERIDILIVLIPLSPKRSAPVASPTGAAALGEPPSTPPTKPPPTSPPPAPKKPKKQRKPRNTIQISIQSSGKKPITHTIEQMTFVSDHMEEEDSLIYSGTIFKINGLDGSDRFLTFHEILREKHGIDYDKDQIYKFFVVKPKPKPPQPSMQEQLAAARKDRASHYKQNQIVFNMQGEKSTSFQKMGDLNSIFGGTGVSVASVQCIFRKPDGSSEIIIDQEFAQQANSEMDEYIQESYDSEQKLCPTDIINKVSEILTKYDKDPKHTFQYCNVLSQYTINASNVIKYMMTIIDMCKSNPDNFMINFAELISAIPSDRYKMEIFSMMPPEMMKSFNIGLQNNKGEQVDMPKSELFIPEDKRDKSIRFIINKEVFDADFWKSITNPKFNLQGGHKLGTVDDDADHDIGGGAGAAATADEDADDS